MHTDVVACDCAQGVTDTVREFALEVACGRKTLAAPGTQNCVSIVPGFSVRCSTN